LGLNYKQKSVCVLFLTSCKHVCWKTFIFLGRKFIVIGRIEILQSLLLLLYIYFINVFVARLGSTAGKFVGGGGAGEEEREREQESEKRERGLVI
jgi:hypothetical protein